MDSVPAASSVVYAGRFVGRPEGDAPLPTSHEIMLLISGTYDIQVGSVRLTGSEGDVFLLPPGIPQVKHTPKTMKTAFILHARSHEDPSPRTVHVPTSEPVGRWIEDLCDLYQAVPPTPPVFLEDVLDVILQRLHHLESRAQDRHRRHPGASRVAELMERDPQRTYSMTHLASEAQLSTSHLNTVFRHAFGSPPLQYLLRLRMHKARNLLKDPYLTLTDIAASCGYADVNYFMRTFRQHVGVSPGAWRRQRYGY